MSKTLLLNNTTGAIQSPVTAEVFFRGNPNLMIDVRQYGAVGDGVTDDTAAFQEALNEGSIYIPDTGSEYITSDIINIPSDRHLVFDPSATLKRLGATVGEAEACFFQNSDQVGGNSNITIEGGIFNGDCANVTRDDSATQINGVGFRFNKVTNLRLENIQVVNTETFGMQIAGTVQGYFHNIWFNNTITSPNQDGLHIDGPSSDLVIDGVFGNSNDDLLTLNANAPAPYAWSQGDITDVLVRNVRFDGSYGGFLLLSNTNLIDRVVVENLSGTVTNKVIDISTFAMGGVGNVGSLIFRNINVVNTNNTFVQILCSTVSKSIIIDGVNRAFTTDSTQGIFGQSGSNQIDFLTLSNCTWIAPAQNSSALATIKNVGTLSMVNCSYKYNFGGALRGRLLTLSASASAGIVNIIGCYAENIQYPIYVDSSTVSALNIIGSNFEYFEVAIQPITGTISRLNISGSTFNGVSGAFAVISPFNNSTIPLGNMSDTHVSNVNKFISYSGTAVAGAQRWNLSNITFTSTTSATVERGSATTVSVNGTSTAQDRALLTPLTGDVIRNTGIAPQGIVTYNGSAWVSLQPQTGTFTLIAGAATVANTAVTANSVIDITLKTVGGTILADPYIATITPTTGFTVAGGGAANTSVFNYAIRN